jgi:hypothetical protein
MLEVIVPNLDNVRASFGRLTINLTEKLLKEATQTVFNVAQTEADKHTKTGAIARSLQVHSIHNGYEVKHDLQQAPHALFVHWGTKPHKIRPKYKKILRWVDASSNFVFARSVNHPGYKGDPWMVRAKNEAIKKIHQIIKSHVL